MKTLRDMGLERAAHIETGFGGWKSDGLSVETYEQWQAARQD